MAVRNALKPMQRIWSPFLRRITERACIISSYREGTDEINEILHREKDEEKITPANALDIVHQDGALCEECDLEYVGKVFRETPWISDNGIVGDPGKVPEGVRSPKVSEESRELVRKKVDEAASLFNEGRPPAERINRERLCDAFEFHPSDMVFASVDTILVPFQKEHRNVNGETGNNREKKRLGVANGIVTSSEGTFRLTGATEEIVVQKMLAYMIGNNLLENRGLAFFMDGAKSLKKLVEKYFGFREYYYHLDWYHLWKKCYELFSMALYGGKDNKERNNLIRYEFFKRIWAGNIEEAVDYLGTLLESKEKTVKSKPMLNAIIAYVSENKKDDIYSYGARRELGLINSSNAVEKQNDTDVAQYCKECACSWSEDGVLSVAHIALLREQGKDVEWYRSHAVDYSPVPLSETLQARMWMA